MQFYSSKYPSFSFESVFVIKRIKVFNGFLIDQIIERVFNKLEKKFSSMNKYVQEALG